MRLFLESCIVVVLANHVQRAKRFISLRACSSFPKLLGRALTNPVNDTLDALPPKGIVDSLWGLQRFKVIHGLVSAHRTRCLGHLGSDEKPCNRPLPSDPLRNGICNPLPEIFIAVLLGKMVLC